MNPGLVLGTRVVAVASILASIGLMAWAAAWSRSGLGFILALTAWCVSPYALLALVSGRMRASRAGAITVLVTTILVAGAAAVAYVDAFFIHLDAQGALILIFMPVWQWVGTVIGLAVAALFEFRARKP